MYINNWFLITASIRKMHKKVNMKDVRKVRGHLCLKPQMCLFDIHYYISLK